MEYKNKELVTYFFEVMGDERFITLLEKYSQGEGYGVEHVWCVFADDYEEWEEDYFGNDGIAFYFNCPAVEKDDEVILDSETLYAYLKEIGDNYLLRHPEKELEVGNYMKRIKERYKIRKG